MVLMRGATGDPVKDLQRQLNKVGSLLVVDGDLGPATEAAIADARLVLRMPGPPVGDDALVAELRKLPEPSPDVTSPGVTFIGREEVTGPREYRRLYSHPIWPTRASGITIGIGYDLSAVTRVKFEADWGGLLSDNAIDRLGDVTSVRGTEKRRARVEDIEILLPIAVQVFLKTMVPDHVRWTRESYPTLDTLPAARRTALVSLVFNRGRSLVGSRRAEMRCMHDLLAAGTPDPVADQLDAMVRLWDAETEAGVIRRRHREAVLWRSGFEALQLA
jgi:peptidoglycan hydrolase-like protein with peptidoglycan-binding domain